MRGLLSFLKSRYSFAMKTPLAVLLILGLSVSTGVTQEGEKKPKPKKVPVEKATAPNAIRVVETFKGLKIERPISVIVAPDGSGREFLVQQRGQILILPKDRSSKSAVTFLDLSDRKMEEKEFEEGLLGLVFHPKFKENGKFYLYYSQQDPKRSVISEMQVSKDNPDKADPETERILLEVPQPFWNHNSGNMLFGQDGYLYICFGDGGKRDDPLRLAQNLFVFNGKMIRIDVDTKSGAREYGIPKDNPFVGKEGVREEIWAYGLRNPWGIAIDEETGKFWLADVGQDAWEEIDNIEKGGNYGWSYMEGVGKFVVRQEEAPEGSEFIAPVHVYTRRKGISVTGGYVYRGTTAPEWKGHYIFADWGTGKIWAMKEDDDGTNPETNAKQIYERTDDNFKPTGFYPGADGEMLILSWDGKVYEIEGVD